MNKELIEQARAASRLSQSHISKYKVGCAILGKSGKVYLGTNIEFDNFSNTIHAEECAISNFVINGVEDSIEKIAVYTRDTPPWFPCGMCRQSLFEFCDPNTPIIACNDSEDYLENTVGGILLNGYKRRERIF